MVVNLFDIVRQAQSGSAMDNFSRQFGLSLDQTQRAMEALLPAFTLAFQRSVQNPNAFAQLLEMMASGRYAPFFDGGAQANNAQSNGQQILDTMFGSSEVSRQIAAQASAMTGIGAQVLQQMLPALAPVLMGGLFRFTSVEGLSDFLRNWSDWLRMMAPLQAGNRQPSSPAAGTPYGAWTDLMGAMLGQGAARPASAPAADPWTGFMQAFLKGLPPGAAAPPPPKPPASQPNPLEVLSQMFETGRDVQAQYLGSLQAILDGFRSPQGQTKPGAT
jgi:hypothetical protein